MLSFIRNISPTTVWPTHAEIYILIRYWMALWFCLWFCSFAIETTFPLSGFKTKHIFGILMERVTFLKPFGAPQAPQIYIFFYQRRRRRQPPPRVGHPWLPKLLYSFTAAKGGGFSKWSPTAPLPRRAREIPPKAGVSRVHT